jgi:hypothetical protein
MGGIGRSEGVALHEAKARLQADGVLTLRERMSRYPRLGGCLVASGALGFGLSSTQLNTDDGLFLLALTCGSLVTAIGAVLVGFAFDAESARRQSGS